MYGPFSPYICLAFACVLVLCCSAKYMLAMYTENSQWEIKKIEHLLWLICACNTDINCN